MCVLQIGEVKLYSRHARKAKSFCAAGVRRFLALWTLTLWQQQLCTKCHQVLAVPAYVQSLTDLEVVRFSTSYQRRRMQRCTAKATKTRHKQGRPRLAQHECAESHTPQKPQGARTFGKYAVCMLSHGYIHILSPWWIFAIHFIEWLLPCWAWTWVLRSQRSTKLALVGNRWKPTKQRIKVRHRVKQILLKPEKPSRNPSAQLSPSVERKETNGNNETSIGLSHNREVSAFVAEEECLPVVFWAKEGATGNACETYVLWVIWATLEPTLEQKMRLQSREFGIHSPKAKTTRAWRA